MSECCLSGFKWTAEPKGKEAMLAGRSCYVTGTNSEVGVMIIHDIFGWTFNNSRLLADHYAEEVGATVYLPDFFGGEVIPADVVLNDKNFWKTLDLTSFFQRNSKETRTAEIIECAKKLRAKHQKLGAVGFCFGGWGVFRLGSKDNKGLVDCIATAHPTQLEKDEVEAVKVPVLICAPEHDAMFTEELKLFCNRTIPTLGIPYAYQHFPGLTHGFAIRGDANRPAEREGMERAKNAIVQWLQQWLRGN